jgi:alkanesulfonate monooxygenase SsuD/methylene tetrahydromethanopterin reductase-like flavin-dependent oxidoreductase (luciferase family)
MRLGISPFATTRAGVLAVATLAVEAGIETLWMGDGLLVNDAFPAWSGAMEPFTTLAWLSGRLPSAALGVSAAVLPLRDVVWTAKQAATLDQLSAGRFRLAVAPGFWARELEFRGVDPAQRGAVFRRALTELRAVFAGDTTERVAPIPLTAGGPPIWLAGADATFRLALAEGLPFQASRSTPTDLAPLVRRWRDEGGGTFGVRIRMSVAAEVPSDAGVEWNALVGPPSFLAEQLDAYREIGVDDVSIIPGQDDESSLRTVAAVIEHL